MPTSVIFLTPLTTMKGLLTPFHTGGAWDPGTLQIQVTHLLLVTYSCLQRPSIEVGGLQCLGGAQLLPASVSWAPTGGGHSARQPLPSPSNLESTHKTHAARRGLAAGRGRCEKRTSPAPLAHARASPGGVGSNHFILLSGS